VAIGVADKQAARLAPYLGKALAAFADRGRVDDGQQLLGVVREERVEKHLVAVLEVTHQGVLRERGRLVIQRPLAARPLLFQRADVRRQKPVQRKLGPFFFSECGALVQFGVKQ